MEKIIQILKLIFSKSHFPKERFEIITITYTDGTESTCLVLKKSKSVKRCINEAREIMNKVQPAFSSREVMEYLSKSQDKIINDFNSTTKQNEK